MPEHLKPATPAAGCTTMPIRRFLDLSTAHLQQAERVFLRSPHYLLKTAHQGIETT